MDREFDAAYNSGMNQEKYFSIVRILDAIIAECKLDYSKEKLSVDSDVLTTILKVYDRNKVESQVKFLQEEQNND